MPQIREQIAMVHLPPSKTLKYLFHVRKTGNPLQTAGLQGVFLSVHTKVQTCVLVSLSAL